jgi:ketosteroid isomerase-like protein
VSPESEVLAANEAFYDAVARRDPAAMDVLWSRIHPVACIHPGWQALRTREEIMASWEAIMSNPQQPRIVAGGAEASVLDDIAIVICREFVAGASLLATNVFAREEGRWRIVHHHSGPVAMVET